MGDFSWIYDDLAKVSGDKSYLKSKPVTNSPADALRKAAGDLGVDPIDLGSIISFESAGSFDPHKVGGEGNKYKGLIQFGPDEQKRYYRPDDTFESQVQNGVVNYFRDRFKKVGKDTRGASLEDLYTTVIAGNPNANRNAKDSFGTSAKSGAQKIFNEHRPKVISKFFGGHDPSATDLSFLTNDIAKLDTPDVTDLSFLSQDIANLDNQASPQTAPESAATITAQAASAADPNTPRPAVLLNPGQIPDARDPQWTGFQAFKAPKTPDRFVMVNLQAAKKLGLKDADHIQNYLTMNPKAFETLGVRVEPVADTSQGTVVTTLAPDGTELNSSIVTSPENAQKQIELDQANHPGGQSQVVDAQDVIAQRNAGMATVGASALPTDIQQLEQIGEAAKAGERYGSAQPTSEPLVRGTKPIENRQKRYVTDSGTITDIPEPAPENKQVIQGGDIEGKLNDARNALDAATDPAKKQEAQKRVDELSEQLSLRNRAEAERIDIPDNIKTLAEANKYVADTLKAKYGDVKIPDNFTIADWQPGHGAIVDYGTLKQIGVDIDPTIREKVAENRTENPALDLAIGKDWTAVDAERLNNAVGPIAAKAIAASIAAGGRTANAMAGLLRIIQDLSPTKLESLSQAAKEKPYRPEQDVADYLKGIGETTGALQAKTGEKYTDVATEDDKGSLPGRPIQREAWGSKGAAAVGMLSDLPRMALMPGGVTAPFISFATDSALQAASEGETVDWSKVGTETKKGGALGAVSMLAPGAGKVLEEGVATLLNRASSNVLREGITLGTIGGGTYVASRALGDSKDQAFDNAVLFSAMHALGVAKKIDKDITNTPIRIKDANGNEAVIEIRKEGEVKTLDPKTEAEAQIVIPKDIEIPPPETDIVTPSTQGKDVTEKGQNIDTSQAAIDKENAVIAQGQLDELLANKAGKSVSKPITDAEIAARDNPPPKGEQDTAKLNAEIKASTDEVGKVADGVVSGKPKQEPVEPPSAETGESKKPNERSLPKTFEAAQMDKGTNLEYEPETIKHGIERGRQVIADKGIDGAMEFVRSGNGIEWAPTGYAVLEHLRNEQIRVRKSDPERAGKLQEQRIRFLDDFAEEATKRGQSIVGVKAIEEFAPDRAAYLLNKASQRTRKRPITPQEDERVTKLGLELERERNRAKGLEDQLASAEKASGTKSKKTKTPTYLDALEKSSEEAKASIVARLGKLDLQGVTKAKQFEGQKGAVGEQKELPGDAELIAKYAAGRLHKVDTVEGLNNELLDVFGKEIEPHLPDIRRRAYQIRQDARLAALEAADTAKEQRRTIIQDIKAEITEANNAVKAQDKTIIDAENARRKEGKKTQTAEARLAAKKAITEQRAQEKALTDEARQKAKDFKKSLSEARLAETKGYRASIKAQRQAEKEAAFWDTPMRNMAEEAKARLADATPDSPDLINDLASVGAEKFLRNMKGGVPGKRAISPAQFYREMQAEYPGLVTRKNQSEIYKQSYQRIQDVVAAGRMATQLKSASKVVQDVWADEGIDTNTQAVLIQRATNARRQQELRSDMAAEFNRVSQSRFKRIGKEILNSPRALMTSLNMHQGRQGLFTLLTHPISISAKVSVPATVRGFRANRETFLRLTEELKGSPGYDLAEQSGLNFAELPKTSTDLKGHIEEDLLQSTWAMKLPWVRKSTQGFILGMNAERLALFNRWAAIGEANGYTFENNPKFFEDAASVANDFTGRGAAPEVIEKVITKTNQLFFAPRLKVSQVKAINDMFNPFVYFGKNAYDPVMKNIMWKTALRTVAGATVAYGTLIALGGKGTNDPDDPDFFKVRFGHTHYDLTGGAGATFKFAYKFFRSVGGYIAGEKQSEYDKPLSVAESFFRKKLAPWPSAIIDFFTGKNAVGQPANLKVSTDIPKTMKENIALRMVLPLIVNEITEGVEDDGWKGLAKTGPASVFGVSEQTYEPSVFRAKQQVTNASTPEDVKAAQTDLNNAKKKALEKKQATKRETQLSHQPPARLRHR